MKKNLVGMFLLLGMVSCSSTEMSITPTPPSGPDNVSCMKCKGEVLKPVMECADIKGDGIILRRPNSDARCDEVLAKYRRGEYDRKCASHCPSVKIGGSKSCNYCGYYK